MIQGCCLKKEVLHGFETVILENELLKVSVLVGKGADIYECIYKPQNLDFMWHFRGLDEIARAERYARTESSNFFHLYEGAWQEIFPNGGPSCEYKGAILPTHGEVHGVMWQYEVLCENDDQVSVRFFVETRRTPFALSRTMTIKKGESVAYVESEIENLSPETLQCMWGHHPALGAPFLSEACKIYTSARKVKAMPGEGSPYQRMAPGQEANFPFVKSRTGETVDLSKVVPPKNSSADMLFLMDFEGDAQYTVYNHDKNVGFFMQWDKAVMPYIWLWETSGGMVDYPYYGRTYCMALEPFSSYPGSLTRTVENGTALTIEGESKLKMALQFGAVTAPPATRETV